jgi:hypothetical protein
MLTGTIDPVKQIAHWIACSAVAFPAIGCRGGPSPRAGQPTEASPSVQPYQSPAPKPLVDDPATRTGPASPEAPNTPPRAVPAAGTIPSQPAPEPHLPEPFVPANRPPTTAVSTP